MNYTPFQDLPPQSHQQKEPGVRPTGGVCWELPRSMKFCTTKSLIPIMMPNITLSSWPPGKRTRSAGHGIMKPWLSAQERISLKSRDMIPRRLWIIDYFAFLTHLIRKANLNLNCRKIYLDCIRA